MHMKNFFSKATVLKGAGLVVIVAVVVGVSVLAQKYISGSEKKFAEVNKRLADTTSLFNQKIETLQADIDDLKAQNKVLLDALHLTQEQAEKQVSNVRDSVSVLTRLVQTDPELLKKYSKNYFLNEHYVPIALTNIEPQYVYQSGRTLQFHASAYPKLKALLDAAAAAQVSLKVDSAYRSFGTQAQLKASYRVTYGAGTANSFSAEQGYSEHQLGTTVDFTSAEINGQLGGFDKTAAYAWLQANAYNYGFILSYPKDNTYYTYEPWHWRYVSTPLATKLHQDNMHFYDADQRVIDGYLVDIFN